MSGRSVLGALRLQGVLLKQQSSLGFSDTVRRSFDLSLPLSVCSSCTFPSHTLVMSAGWERSELRCTAPHVSWERFPFIGIKEALRGEHQLFLVPVHLLHHTLQRTGAPCSLGFAVCNIPRTAHPRLLAGGVSGQGCRVRVTRCLRASALGPGTWVHSLDIRWFAV